jgi:hypothetical protein
MVRIWGREVEAHPDQPLPPVIPVVLAHVSGGWTASTRFIDMFQRHLERWSRAILAAGWLTTR